MSSLNDTLACVVCGGGSDIGGDKEGTSSTKMCTSCEQKVRNIENKLNELGDAADIDTTDIDTLSEGFSRVVISDDRLFADPPPKEDCSICFLPIPFSSGDSMIKTEYKPCCGKMICQGCMVASDEEMAKGNIKMLCELCRVPVPSNEKEFIKRVKKRMKLMDSQAFCMLGSAYANETWGLPQDTDRAMELFNQALLLGSNTAHFNLAYEYFKGELVERDMDKATHHYTLAAIGGHERARDGLGIIEVLKGNMDLAQKHWMIAARSGYELSLQKVGEGYKDGFVTKEEYATTLRAYQVSVDDMKSEQRERARTIPSRNW
jgi:hypothetical protein